MFVTASSGVNSRVRSSSVRRFGKGYSTGSPECSGLAIVHMGHAVAGIYMDPIKSVRSCVGVPAQNIHYPLRSTVQGSLQPSLEVDSTAVFRSWVSNA